MEIPKKLKTPEGNFRKNEFSGGGKSTTKYFSAVAGCKKLIIIILYRYVYVTWALGREIFQFCNHDLQKIYKNGNKSD